MFTWASEFGVGVMGASTSSIHQLTTGIEWLNDSTLILLFPTPAAALLSLSMLAKAGFDPTEGDDPLLERAAHGFPPSLLPLREPTPEPVPDRQAELDAELDLVASQRDRERSGSRGDLEGTELLGDSAPTSDDGVQRKGRGAFRADRKPKTSANGAFDLPPLASDKTEVRFAEGVDPHARVTVRYAMEDDNTKFKRGAGESSWYARHGRSAGKETAARRNRGGRFEEPLDLKDRVGTSGEGREFARRIGHERYEEREGRRGPRRPRVEDLDADLDRMRRGEDDGRDYGSRYDRERSDGGRYERRGRRDGGGGRAPRRPRANQDDLDRGELREARILADGRTRRDVCVPRRVVRHEHILHSHLMYEYLTSRLTVNGQLLANVAAAI